MPIQLAVSDQADVCWALCQRTTECVCWSYKNANCSGDPNPSTVPECFLKEYIANQTLDPCKVGGNLIIISLRFTTEIVRYRASRMLLCWHRRLDRSHQTIRYGTDAETSVITHLHGTDTYTGVRDILGWLEKQLQIQADGLSISFLEFDC